MIRAIKQKLSQKGILYNYCAEIILDFLRK